MERAKAEGHILTGLLYMSPESKDLHTVINTVDEPLNTITQDKLCPGSDVLRKLNANYR